MERECLDGDAVCGKRAGACGTNAGLAEGDAHVVRNAGGRASDDAIRSLVISYKLLGTKEWLVIHHTDCGMQLFSDEIIAGLLDKSLDTATIDAHGWRDTGKELGSVHGHFVKWHTIANLEESVVEDVARLRTHPLVPKRIPIYGYIFRHPLRPPGRSDGGDADRQGRVRGGAAIGALNRGSILRDEARKTPSGCRKLP